MKKPLAFSLFMILTAAFNILSAQKTNTLLSPDKQLSYDLRLTSEGPQYGIRYKGNPVIAPSLMKVSFGTGGYFSTGLKPGKPVFQSGEEKYELKVGRTRFVNDAYNEMLIPLTESGSPFRTMHIRIRAFNDGIAFRYEFPADANAPVLIVHDELTQFAFPGDPVALALLLPDYTTSHEGEYTHVPVSAIPQDTLADMPALFELPGKVYAVITEAALSDYAGMYLGKDHGILCSKLSPLPGKNGTKVITDRTRHSPWRVIMISDRIGRFQETNILTSLNEPCKINDLSWIKPGKTTFPWWNGNVVPDTINAPGNNFVTNQYYIDFCARNHIQYHSVVEYGLHQWYTDDGINFQPGPHADVTRPVPGLNMKEICDYAHTKAVDVRVWVHWAALYPKLDSAFAIFEQWGLSGMMVDFMDRDDQEMVRIQEEILQKAAAHHLHIQFHGAYKPTGMQRTYPNEYTREGTLNYEVNKWDKRITPDHDLNIVFTRNLAGSTDYHLGGFRAVPDQQFRVQYTRPQMLGTRCHMLGMYVVLENYLAMVCDYPEAYEGQPGFEFIQQVPTTWDQTKVLQAALQQYIVTARQKGSDWYIGAINNHEARKISVRLDFLGSGTYTATIFRDAAGTDQHPNELVKEARTVTGNDTITLELAAGGGAAIQLTAQKQE